MDTWSPLFSSIVASSIWGQKPHVKIVWVTMVAVKDRDGMVVASLPGLARLAVVTVEECREAIAIMLAPDPDSKSSEFEGRKIEVVDGVGWKVLGHERFQKKMREVSDRIGNARRQAAHRDRKRTTNGKPLAGEEKTLHRLEEGEITQEQADDIASHTREVKGAA